MAFRILTINPGATSTKIALFRDAVMLYEESVAHGAPEIQGNVSLKEQMIEQIPFRKNLILDVMKRGGIECQSLDAIAGRGGMLAPLPGGVYAVSQELLADAREMKYGEHASCLGPILADEFAGISGCPAFVVDPETTDEFIPEARFSGISGIERISRFHALNHKAVARSAAISLGKRYEDVRLIVAHLGTGVSVGAHIGGRVADATDPLGDGSFSVDRAGGIPSDALVEMCFSGEYKHEEVKHMLNGNGGVYSYLGSKDMRLVEDMVKNGDAAARGVIEAFAFQIAKDIGSMAAVCSGKVDKVVITGGMARFGLFVNLIRSRVEFIAPIEIIPGEEEMPALAEGVLRVLSGEESPRDYFEEKRKRFRGEN